MTISITLACELYEAFTEAKTLCEEGMDETAAARYMLPWLHDEVARTKRLLGDDHWPYGLERNRDVLGTFLRYPHEQRQAASRLQPEDLFVPEDLLVPETLEATRV